MAEEAMYALSIGMYFNGDITREKEYEEVGKAYNKGYTLVVGDRYSDETVYMLKPVKDLKKFDRTDPDTLENSLKELGYNIVDIFKWGEMEDASVCSS
jgi:hypothetical protein